jgi:hypothetical protein
MKPSRRVTFSRYEQQTFTDSRYSGTWGNGATAGPGFGLPLTGITNQLPARSLQFSAKFRF